MDDPSVLSFKANKKFDWSLFRKDTVKIYFDALYGFNKERFQSHQYFNDISIKMSNSIVKLRNES